jgi:hypothetical protein
MGRDRYKKKNKSKSTNFAGIPRWVVETLKYKSLSGSAVKLLVLLAYQYKGKNNGELCITHSLLKEYFKSNTTMYKARDELYHKGFIDINAYGGKSFDGKKMPHLYALTWEEVNDFIKLVKNCYRFTHLPIGKEPTVYFVKGGHPKPKNTKQIKAQYKKDIKKANVNHNED